MDKIRVLQCIETISSGGVEQTRLTLARHLPKERFEIKIICTYAGGPIPENLRNEGIELVVVGSMKHPFSIKIHKQVQEVVASFKPHIIHGGVFEGNSMAAISGFLKKVPVIILEETSDPQNRSFKADWLLRQFMRLADAIIAISPDVEQYLLSKARISKEKVRLINNGVTIPQPIPEKLVLESRQKYLIKNDDIVIGFVGRLYNDHKRVTDLVEAVALINQPNLKLLIVGEGRDRQIIEEKIKSLQIEDKVIMAGFQENTGLYYSMMDILCVPSSREGFGLVAVEGMLHHKPVVGSKVGGLQNIILDGENGFLVPPLQPELFAEKLKVLIGSKSLREAMGNSGYDWAMKNYSGEKYAQEVGELYEWGLRKKGLKNKEIRK